MKAYPFILGAAVLAAGCAQPSTRLRDAIQQSYVKPPCDNIIGLESSTTRPVPLDKPGLFKIFYYAWSGTDAFYFYTPFGEAVIDVNSGNPISCDRLTETPRKITGPRWTEQADRLSETKFEAKGDWLDAQTEAIGALYQSKRTPTAADKRLAEKYLKSFEALSEPALESYYYRANPDFWEWLRGLIGRSIPKPS